MNNVLIFLLCVVVADFITGLVHWLEDTYGVPSWPFGLGKHVIEPNILHHENPTAMITMSTILKRNYQTGVPAIIVIAICVYFWGWANVWPLALILFLAGCLGNEVHAWNHTPRQKLPRWIRFLQDTAIIQTRKQHAIHHQKPYDQYYCTLTNVTNAVLESFKFWRKLEWLVARFGIKVKRGTPERRGY